MKENHPIEISNGGILWGQLTICPTTNEVVHGNAIRARGGR
jgi:hypothetical protein